MSVDAVGYVLRLTECPDGAELDPAKKCILFCLADHHNRSTRVCEPGIDLLIGESLQSRASVFRQLDYLERHCVIERQKPHGVGAGKLVNYVFLALDDMDRLARKLQAMAQGSQIEPLLSAAEGSQKGLNSQGKRVSEGSQIDGCNKEESVIKGNRMNHTCTRGISTGKTPAWSALPKGLQERVLREVRIAQESTVGKRLYNGDATAEQIAAHEQRVMQLACERAGIWQDRAEKIAQEFYQLALHEETEKRQRILEGSDYGDEQHA